MSEPSLDRKRGNLACAGALASGEQALDRAAQPDDGIKAQPDHEPQASTKCRRVPDLLGQAPKLPCGTALGFGGHG